MLFQNPFLRLLLLLSCLGNGLMAFAQETKDIYDMSLEELVNLDVVSASRFKQKSSEAPSAVDVVTADDIRSFGWRTLADALNAMRGLHLRNDRAYQHLGSRGFLHDADFNARILLMIDGRRMNDAMFDSAFLGEEFMLDMNLIDRIEYIPGSGSAVYGANAFIGVINVITKQGKDFKGARVSGEVGSLDTYRGRATFGKQWENGTDLLVNASQFYSHGEERLNFPEFLGTNGGIAQNMDLERSKRLFGQVSYQDFTLRAGYIERFKRNPTAPFGSLFNDKSAFTNDRQLYVDLDYNTTLSNNLGLQLRGFYHRYDHNSSLPFLEGEDGEAKQRVIGLDEASGRWAGGEAKLTGMLFDQHKWTAGVEVQYDLRQQLYAHDITPFKLYNRSNNGGWRAGLYVQDEYRITDNLLLNAGLRLDQHHLIKDLQLNPRIGLIWDVTPALTTKLLYGSAFRAPNIYERDRTNPDIGFLANPNNAEEHVKSYEGVVEWRPGDGYRLMGDVFYNNFTRLLEQQKQDDSGKFTNNGKFHSYGFELEGEKRWSNGRLVKLSWTHSEVKDDDQGGIVSADAPKNLVKFHYAEPLFNNSLSLGFEEIFVDQRRTLGSNTAPAYNLFNINLATVKPFYGFQATLGIYNVLDQHYKMLGGSEHNLDESENKLDTLTMDGRTVRFRLEYGF